MPCHLRLHAVVAELRAIDNLGCPALALDERLLTLRWNREFLELFPEQEGHIHVGEPYAENLRRFCLPRLDPQEREHIERYLAEGIERHRRQTGPFEFLHRGRWIRAEVLPLPGGGKLRFWTPASPPWNGDDLAAGMALSGEPITEDVIEQIADGIVLRDQFGKILLANRRFAETYGLTSPAEAVGKSFPEVLALVSGPVAAAEEAQRCWTDNSRFPGAPFELPLPADRWVRVREHRTHGGSLIGTHVDLTEHHRLRRSEAKARQRAEELAARLAIEIEERERAELRLIQAARLASLVEMATGLAHELNQPLAVMALAADNAVLQLSEVGEGGIPAALQCLERVATAAVRSRSIIDHLRILGRREDQHAPLGPVNLNDVLNAALAVTEAALRSAGIALTLSRPPIPPWVRGETVPLEQVIMNLLLNACDAIVETGRPGGTVTLGLEVVAGRAILTVADNGGGFSDAALLRALEPFFTTKEPGKGMGLGMSLAYATISAFGGEITFGNTASGAVVRISLPMLRAPSAIA